MWTALTVRPSELDKVPTTLVFCIGKGRECFGIIKIIMGKNARRGRKKCGRADERAK